MESEARPPARASQGVGWHRLHLPVSVFLIVFGVTRVGSLLDWSRRHGDAVRTLGLGGGTATALLIAAGGAELLLTAAAVLAIARRRDVWLFAALVGWPAEFAVLAVMAGFAGDVGKLVEHIIFFLAFVGLLAATYALSAAARVAGRAPHFRPGH